MPLVYGKKLPDYSVRLLENGVDALDVKRLLFIANDNPSLFRGFRLIKSSEQLIRKRFKNNISVDGELNRKQISLFRHVTLAQRLICVFSYDALSLNKEDLAVFFGVEEFITGLYFDSREEVRELANSIENNHKKLEHKCTDEAERNLKQSFSDFLSLIKTLCDSSSISKVDKVEFEQTKMKLDKAEKKISLLNDELLEVRANNSSLKKAERRITRLEQLNDEKEQKIYELKKRICKQNDELINKKKLVDTLRTELDVMRNSFNTKLDERVREKLATLENRWLKVAVETDCAVSKISVSSNNLIEQAEKLIEAQVERDKHFGNIQHLSDKRSELLKARSKLVQARRKSINPLTELGTLIAHIEREIDGIDKHLGVNTKLSDFTLKCIDKISDALDFDELLDRYSMVISVRNAGVLSQVELTELEKAYAGKARELITSLPYCPQSVPENPFLQFIYSISNVDTEILLLLDGHNILHKMSSFFEKYFDNGVPGGAARKALIDIMENFNVTYPNTSVNIYFDAPESSQQNISKHLKVVYSGGGYVEHRADRVIMDYLEFLDNDGRTGTVAVVSDDGEIADFTSEKGALTLSVDDFALIISER